MHPELVRLEEQYNRLIDDCQAGHISYEQALSALEHLTVIDGEGSEWGIDEFGHFFRRRIPGAPPEVCDPSLFIPSQLPSRPGGAVPVWDNPDLMSPPGAPQSGPGPVMGWGGESGHGAPVGPGPTPYPHEAGSPYPPPGSGHGQAPTGYPQAHDGVQRPGYGTDPSYRAAPEAAYPTSGAAPYVPGSEGAPYAMGANAGPLPGPHASAPARGFMSKFSGITGAEWVQKNKRLLVVAGIVLVLILFVLARSGGGSSDSTKPSATTPTVATLPTNSPTGDTPPVTGPPTQPVVPDVSTSKTVTAQLMSGNRGRVGRLFSPAPNTNQVKLITATYAGFKKVGLTIVVGDATSTGPGTATQPWSVVDGSSTVATATVNWVQDSQGEWYLSAAPDFQTG